MRYSGGTLRHDQIDCSSRVSIINGLRTTLVGAGWTSANAYAKSVGTFTGVPANGEQIAVDGQAYTFKTVLASAYDVLIGGTADACASNLVDAVMDNSANEGTTYGTGTVAHTTCNAAKTGTGVVTITSKTAGPGVSFPLVEGLSNFTLSTWTASGGGFDLTCAPNNAGHKMTLQLRDFLSGHVYVYGTDGLFTSEYCNLFVAASRLLEVFASKHAVFTCLLGSTSGTLGTDLQAGVLYIRDNAHLPKTISAVEDDGTGQVKVTTTTAHGLITGDHVYIAYAEGLTSINNRWEIQVVDTTHYILKTSVYAAGYTANSARASGPSEISRAWFMIGQYDTTGRNTLRQALSFNDHRETLVFNQFGYVDSPGINAPVNFFIDIPISAWGTIVLNFPGSADVIEARCGWSVSAPGATKFKVGELYNVFYTNTTVPVDTLLDNEDGYNWFCYGTSRGASLWIARTTAV